ncbi:T-complex protein 11-like protein 1 [Lethenteron reissneri]|uniref:T-complex protein 11-like protein 1 n=1 Tax=Lethenteron reissneri TaxID=7753 RepID=UPI002AB77B0A|nr:T-complex protein 11-like protein 1 [Lethenteron reissneri]
MLRDEPGDSAAVSEDGEMESPSGGSASGSPPESPPGLVSPDVHTATRSLEKMILAHEIALDPDFSLQRHAPPDGSLEKAVTEAMHKAFWDILETELLRDPPEFSGALRLMGEIQETLLSLLPSPTRRSLLPESLDAGLLMQQAKAGTLDVVEVGGSVVRTMAMLCAPMRDADVRALARLAEDAAGDKGRKDVKMAVSLYREIFRVLDLMKQDYANFSIRCVRPWLQANAGRYEQSQFDHFLRAEPNALELTRRWLEAAVSHTPSRASVFTPGATARTPGVVTPVLDPSVVLSQAFLDLLAWEPGEPYPETVAADRGRLEEAAGHVRRLRVQASVLLVLCGGGWARELVRGQQAFLAHAKHVVDALTQGACHPPAMLAEALGAVSEQLDVDLCRLAEQRGLHETPAAARAALCGQIRDLCKPGNPVASLVASRVNDYLKGVVEGRSSISMPGGLAPVGPELENVAMKFARLVMHNRNVFGTHYLRILCGLIVSPAQAGLPGKA